jgi:putative ATP-dependent endonuclease of OLD family
VPEDSGASRIAYPGKCFTDDNDGKASKAYVERYLDATKSNLLFSKGVILVEGLAEQLVLPVLAEYIGCPLEEHHVALIPVGGLTFKHFLPLFGAGLTPEKAKHALSRPIACLVDADPTKKPTGTNEKFKKCYPYEVNRDTAMTYQAQSSAISALRTLANERKNILIEPGNMTFEYDLAIANHTVGILVTDACTHAEKLRSFIADTTTSPPELDVEKVRSATLHLAEPTRTAHIVATCYLDCVDNAKGEHGLALARAIKDAKDKPAMAAFKVPSHIARVIRWASRQPEPIQGTTQAQTA